MRAAIGEYFWHNVDRSSQPSLQFWMYAFLQPCFPQEDLSLSCFIRCSDSCMPSKSTLVAVHTQNPGLSSKGTRQPRDNSIPATNVTEQVLLRRQILASSKLIKAQLRFSFIYQKYLDAQTFSEFPFEVENGVPDCAASTVIRRKSFSLLQTK